MLFMLHVSYHITHTGNYTLGEKKLFSNFMVLKNIQMDCFLNSGEIWVWWVLH
jgi:hypothetical protein